MTRALALIRIVTAIIETGALARRSLSYNVRVRFAGILLCGLALATPSRSEEEKLDPEVVRRLIERLADPALEQRDAAARRLKELGRPLLPFIEKAFDHPNPEIRRRARLVKKSLPVWWGTPKPGSKYDSESSLPLHVLDDRTGIDLVLIRPGAYTRGASPDDQEAFDSEKPAHKAEVKRYFYLAPHELTQRHWLKVMAENPSHELDPRYPVTNVSWNAIQEFLKKAGMRLPTEVEWEYACRAGTAGPRYGLLDKIAWHPGNAEQKIHVVGRKRPNDFGLFDMLGNVWEWCADAYVEYDLPPPAGADLLRNPRRVVRGGCFDSERLYIRASVRWCCGPDKGWLHVGFRVARDP